MGSNGTVTNSGTEALPIVYFTQLLGLALGLDPQQLQLDAHQMENIRETEPLKVL
jgi:heterodisulfide reductase subunit B